VQNVPKVPLSIVLQINDLTPSKSTFTTDINSLQLNAKKIYQMELFSGCHARLAEKTELSGHLGPCDIAYWLNCSLISRNLLYTILFVATTTAV
jgi:hypothetical protein